MLRIVGSFIIVMSLLLNIAVVVNAQEKQEKSENVVNMSGTYLKDEYIAIPSLTIDKKGDTCNLINPNIGTIECWFKPDWRLNEVGEKAIIFYGDFSNNNSMLIVKDGPLFCTTLASKEYKFFYLSLRLEGHKEKYNMEPGIWHHIAVCWDVEAAKKTVKIFLDGRNDGEIIMGDNRKAKWAIAEKEFDGIQTNSDILIGARKDNNGVKDLDKLIVNTILPGFEVAQFRISNTLRYDSPFTPEQKLYADDNTLLYMSLADDLEGEYYKNGVKIGTIRGKLEKLKK